MTDPDNQAPDDPWLTLAEIAEELRVNPATVRLWVSQGKLGATRAGRRKLLVRRSEVDRMLEASQGRQRSEAPPQGGRRPAPLRPVRMRTWSLTALARAEVDPEERRAAAMDMQRAAAEWDVAIDASENAPPDPGFARRLRAIAKASEHQAEALGRAQRIPGSGWTPLPESDEMMILSHELRPGGSRPGPTRLWQSFDMTVERLSVAMQGNGLSLVADEYSELALVLTRIAEALEQAAAKRGRGEHGEGTRPQRDTT